MSYFSRNSLRCSRVTVGDEDMLKTFFCIVNSRGWYGASFAIASFSLTMFLYL